MKDMIISKSMMIVRSYNPLFNETKLAEIKYGIEAFYMTLTKLIVIIIISLVLKIFKETIFLLMFFNLLRLTAFGLHASKSWMCWVSSIITFIVLPIVAKNFEIPIYISTILAILCILSYVLYAPADTKKRPIINKKKRKIYKILTVTTGIIYLLLILFFDNFILKNCIVMAMLIETSLILPITYKFFKLSYRNYLAYKNS